MTDETKLVDDARTMPDVGVYIDHFDPHDELGMERREELGGYFKRFAEAYALPIRQKLEQAQQVLETFRRKALLRPGTPDAEIVEHFMRVFDSHVAAADKAESECAALRDALKDSAKSLHAFLATAYTWDFDADGARCNRCLKVSPVNADRSSCTIVHADGCETRVAILTEAKARAALEEK